MLWWSYYIYLRCAGWPHQSVSVDASGRLFSLCARGVTICQLIGRPRMRYIETDVRSTTFGSGFNCPQHTQMQRCAASRWRVRPRTKCQPNWLELQMSYITGTETIVADVYRVLQDARQNIGWSETSATEVALDWVKCDFASVDQLGVIYYYRNSVSVLDVMDVWLF